VLQMALHAPAISCGLHPKGKDRLGQRVCNARVTFVHVFARRRVWTCPRGLQGELVRLGR
jgi:hypothetical protein